MAASRKKSSSSSSSSSGSSSSSSSSSSKKGGDDIDGDDEVAIPTAVFGDSPTHPPTKIGARCVYISFSSYVLITFVSYVFGNVGS